MRVVVVVGSGDSWEPQLHTAVSQQHGSSTQRVMYRFWDGPPDDPQGNTKGIHTCLPFSSVVLHILRGRMLAESAFLISPNLDKL